MEILIALCLGVTLSAACGFRVFLPPLVMSIGAMYGHIPLSSGFEWLGTREAAIALAIATLLEIGAYYVPFLDNLLDTVQIPIAVGIGTMITAATMGHTDPVLQWTLAAIAGGGTAGLMGSLAGLVRLASTGVTGGLGNFIVATLELVGSISLSVLGITFPLWTAAIVLSFIIIGAIVVISNPPAWIKKRQLD
ncbi:DUF4126 domain-containing protein [Waterburya agarophytonicola K14]|uniref:DUF4126 domain-containing protein n=1 Tax=Waterburya agarophytonicola KI4 TaxID=2874699 RepID=A0A964FEF1_9CYAN|nr:DUF4126 domain-containing protein [Waterburya agarophytonicola]MCC0176021.1 DUF4126 domain-containing protein [Waterburya agarophytonicola KI4]